MRHPELDDMPSGASFFGYQPYVTVGYPPGAQPPAQQMPAQPSTVPGTSPSVPLAVILVAVGSAFLGGAALASTFTLQSADVKSAQQNAQQAQIYQQRSELLEQHILEVQNRVCNGVFY